MDNYYLDRDNILHSFFFQVQVVPIKYPIKYKNVYHDYDCNYNYGDVIMIATKKSQHIHEPLIFLPNLPNEWMIWTNDLHFVNDLNQLEQVIVIPRVSILMKNYS